MISKCTWNTNSCWWTINLTKSQVNVWSNQIKMMKNVKIFIINVLCGKEKGADSVCKLLDRNRGAKILHGKYFNADKTAFFSAHYHIHLWKIE